MPKGLDQPQGRGDFFRSFGKLVAGFLAEQTEEALLSSSPRLFRPPGALDELTFLAACTRCDKCIQACPQGTLMRAPSSARLAMGTPYWVPRTMPCFLCEELPCIPACPEGALHSPMREIHGTLTEGRAAVKMGVARVEPERCVTWTRGEEPAEHCRACVDRCPLTGSAIRLVPADFGPPHPEVDAESCVGCGLCEFACPHVRPAIRIHRLE